MLKVNDQIRQSGDLGEMIWQTEEIISQLSRLFKLEPGDLIFSGTPAGVGAVGPGDRLEGEIAGVGSVAVRIGLPVSGGSLWTKQPR